MATTPPTTPTALHIELQPHNDVLVVKVSGMAAAEVAGQLSRSLQEAAQRKPKILAIDLSELNFISSTGLGGLVATHVTCQKNGTQLVLIRPKPFIQEILDVTKLSNLFKIRDALENDPDAGSKKTAATAR